MTDQELAQELKNAREYADVLADALAARHARKLLGEAGYYGGLVVGVQALIRGHDEARAQLAQLNQEAMADEC